MTSAFSASIRLFLALTFLTGVIYPLVITGAAQIAFRRQANGSLIERDGRVIGSKWIAQKFERPEYFWPRPSAIDYNPLPSGGSNLGPTSRDLKSKIDERRSVGMTGDMLYASASGLDPEISPVSARVQAERVAHARKISVERVLAQIDARIKERDLGYLGEPRVNVIELNLAMDAGSVR